MIRSNVVSYILWFREHGTGKENWKEWPTHFATESGARGEARMENFSARFAAWDLEKRTSEIICRHPTSFGKKA